MRPDTLIQPNYMQQKSALLDSVATRILLFDVVSCFAQTQKLTVANGGKPRRNGIIVLRNTPPGMGRLNCTNFDSIMPQRNVLQRAPVHRDEPTDGVTLCANLSYFF